MKSAWRRAQIAANADRVAALTAQLREDISRDAADCNPAYNSQIAAEIQKPAKTIKSLEKQQ